jgi:hypothetical protein
MAFWLAILVWNDALRWLLVGSVVMFVGSLLLLPLVIVRLPADYFTRREPPEGSWRARHGLLRLALRVIKNMVGILLAALGLVMIFTPGQGLVALLVGLSLLDVPGKRKLELTIIGRPGVLRAINAWRARAGRPPLEMPPRKGGRKA